MRKKLMQTFKKVPDQAEMSTAIEQAVRTAQERRRLRSLTLCGTAAGVVTVVGQLRADWPECTTVSQLLQKISWGAPC